MRFMSFFVLVILQVNRSFGKSSGKKRPAGDWKKTGESHGGEYTKRSRTEWEKKCFNCGDFGHMAADCPKKRGY